MRTIESSQQFVRPVDLDNAHQEDEEELQANYTSDTVTRSERQDDQNWIDCQTHFDAPVLMLF